MAKTTILESDPAQIMAFSTPPAVGMPTMDSVGEGDNSDPRAEDEGPSKDNNETIGSAGITYSPTNTADPEPSQQSSNTEFPIDHASTSDAAEPSRRPRSSKARRRRKDYKSKGKEVERGRTLERTPTSPNPLARAESRSRKRALAIEIDSRDILKRPRRSSTYHDDPNSSPAVLDDSLLETCPGTDSCTNVSEVLSTPISRADTLGQGLDIGRARASTTPSSSSSSVKSTSKSFKTVFNTCRPLYPAPTFPPDRLLNVLPNISHLEYMAIKSSSQQWSSSSSRVSSLLDVTLPVSVASSLPTEILQQIYSHLTPPDFNSTRHTCRSWFINSLERSLLETMLKRGGWFAGSQYDIAGNHVLESQFAVNDEWLMSKRIARECALGPDWTGNGLSRKDAASKPAFVHAAKVDFTDVAVHYSGTESAGTVFTVSSCGKFLMVSNGCLVYIYELNRNSNDVDGAFETEPGSLRPITSIICPQRVLSCSMDTSSHRYAIAVLLDGQMGLVCDIALDNFVPRTRTPESGRCTTSGDSGKDGKGREAQDERGMFQDQISLNSSSAIQQSSQTATYAPSVLSGSATMGISSQGEFVRAVSQDIIDGDSVDSNAARSGSIASSMSRRTHSITPGGRLRSILPPCKYANLECNSMPIETGPRSLYRNICSDDDLPRSVAICPQRRCVAFGCSAGIELHWVDALTGQDLNRWFPLTAPSDFLFFLPPRKSVDSAKKLRLISSAAKPSERAAAIERAFGGRARSSPFWESFGWGVPDIEENNTESNQGQSSRLRPDANQSANNRVDSSDHYRAVPLSDGYHILFTDPATGLLCLGSDAPVGGPTKLLRKIWFQGPAGKGRPVVYAAGSDLRWGVKVVAAFGTGDEQSIWLFSVPGDVFASHQSANMSTTSFLLYDHSNVATNTDWMDWWPEDGLRAWFNRVNDPLPGILPRRVRPVRIQGQEIGSCHGLVDLTIDSGPIMTIWAFSKEGVANVWRINDGKQAGIKHTLIARDGTIRKIDNEGDIEMMETPSPDVLRPPLPLGGPFDGANWSTETVATVSRFARRDRVSWSATSFTHDPDGDVIMQDQEEPRLTERQRNDVFWAKYGWSEASYRGQINTVREDVVEDLAGIARIDIEIR